MVKNIEARHKARPAIDPLWVEFINASAKGSIKGNVKFAEWKEHKEFVELDRDYVKTELEKARKILDEVHKQYLGEL